MRQRHKTHANGPVRDLRGSFTSWRRFPILLDEYLKAER